MAIDTHDRRKGRPIYSNGKCSLCHIAARMMGFESGRHFYDQYWKKYEEHEQVQRFIEVGKLMAEEDKQSYFNELVKQYCR